jgi:hypothetical protein
MNRISIKRAVGLAAGLVVACVGLRPVYGADLYSFQGPPRVGNPLATRSLLTAKFPSGEGRLTRILGRTFCSL